MVIDIFISFASPSFQSFASPYALFRGRGTTYHLDTVVKLHVCSECCQYFLSLGTHHQSYFSTASCAQILSKGTEEGSEEIDFEFLFQPCTKIHLAKRLHALLIVLGKAQSIFISTRVVNLYANLGDVTYSRCTFDQIPNLGSCSCKWSGPWQRCGC
ncbi:hypothetical protein ACSBR1_007312 [Camellia fascicularis]